MNHTMNNKGLTLVELMIVLAIIGILGAIAYPSYQDHMRKTYRSEGKAKLLEILGKEQNYFTRNMSYTTDLKNDLNYANDPLDSDSGRYKIRATTCAAPYSNQLTGCVKLIATAQGMQVKDGGPLTINSAGDKKPADKW